MPDALPTVAPSYEQALFADLDTALERLRHDRVAVQWDVAVEFGALEGAMGPKLSIDQVAPGLVRCIERVPADVPAGMHLCYGDYGHQHFKQPESLQMQVDLINAVTFAAGRPVNFVSFTVPQGRATAPTSHPSAAYVPVLTPSCISRWSLITLMISHRARPPSRSSTWTPPWSTPPEALATGGFAPNAGWAESAPVTSPGFLTSTARFSRPHETERRRFTHGRVDPPLAMPPAAPPRSAVPRCRRSLQTSAFFNATC